MSNPCFLSVLALALALAVPCLPAGAQDFRGRCVRVLSGDTLEALKGPRRVTVHLAGIAAPNPRQPFGEAARKALSRFALDKDLIIREQLRDRTGVIHAVVLASEDSSPSLNLALVRAGLAWRETTSNLVKGLDACETQARAERGGLWRDPAPVAPWEWRTLAAAGKLPKPLFTSDGQPIVEPPKTPSAFTPPTLASTRNAPPDDNLLKTVIQASQRQGPSVDLSARVLAGRIAQRGPSLRSGSTRRLGGGSGGLATFEAPFESWTYYPAPTTTQLGNGMTIRSAVVVPQGVATGFSLGR